MYRLTSSYPWAFLARLLALILSIGALTYASLVFLTFPDGDSGLWLPGGLGVAVLLVGGMKYWPGILAGVIAGAAVVDSTSLIMLPTYACYALAPFATAWLFVRLRWQGDPPEQKLLRLRDFIMFGFAAGFGAALTTVAGISVLWLSGVLESAMVALELLQWWMGIFLGMVLIAPLFLVWQTHPFKEMSLSLVAEAFSCVLLAFLCGQAIFLGWFGTSVGAYVHNEWLFIFAVWAAVRLGLPGVTFIVAMIAIQAMFGITHAVAPQDTRLLDVQFIDYWVDMIIFSLVGSSLATSIHKLQRIQEALDHDRTLLRGVMDSIPDLIFYKDRTSTYIGCNKAFERYFGASEADIVGKTDLDFVDAERAEIYRSEDVQVLADGQAHFNEVLTHYPDGRSLLLEKLKTPYQDAKGVVRGIIGISRDITRRTLAERRETLANIVLRHLSARGPLAPALKVIVDSVEQDMPGVRCSILLLDEAEEHLNLGSAPSLPEFYRQAIQGALVRKDSIPCGIAASSGDRFICADVRQHAWEPYRELAAKAAIGACWSEPIKSYSGNVLGVFSMLLPVPAEPVEDDLYLMQLISNLAAIAIERGRMEQSERAYRTLSQTLETLINALPMQVALLDAMGDIVKVNRVWRKFHVDHPAVMQEMSEGYNLLERFPAVLGQSGKPVLVADGVKNVLFGVTAQYVCEILLQRDDRGYWYQLAVVPVMVEGDEKSSALIMLTDITQSRKTQESLYLREQEFRALAENSPDMVLRLNIEGRFLYVNPVVLEVTGATLSTIMGRSIEEVWRNEDVITAWHAAIFTLFNSESTRELVEFELILATEKHFFQASLVPEYGSGRRKVISILTVIRDITNLKQAEGRLIESQERLREMVKSSAMMIERERKYIASELHDELGQLLTVLRMEVAMLKLTYGIHTPALADKADEMMGMLDNCIQGMRKAISRMRPMALDLGLVPAIEWLCDEFTLHYGLPCIVTGLDDLGEHCLDGPCPLRDEACVLDSDGMVHLDEERSIVVFRIVQESLTNIARHAAASRVEVKLTCDGSNFRVTIVDDGRGMDENPVNRGDKKFGVLGMEERAFSLGGTLNVTGIPGRGTTVSLIIPNSAVSAAYPGQVEEE